MGKVAKEDILPTNYEVLQRELPILDIMTRNRERRIWAIARGERSSLTRRSTTRRRRRSSTQRRTSRRRTPFISGEAVARGR